MNGVFLLAWVVFPALMLVLSGGAGLAVRRLTGPAAVPALLVVPVGLATLVVVCGLFCYFAPLAPLAAGACVLVGVLGLVLGRGSLRDVVERRARGVDLWAVGAAFGAGAVVAAPVVLSGKPGFTGYAHIVDIAYQFDLAAHFAHSGRSIPTLSSSAYQSDMIKYLGSGYPGGGQWMLGALSNLTPVDLSWLYQPFLAFLAAMSALSLYALLSPLLESRALRALGAFVAAQPNILLAYVLAGGIKELSTSCFLLLSAALLAQVLPRVTPGRTLLAIPIALSATFASLSLTTVPWIGVLSAGVLLTVLLVERERARALWACGQIAVVTFALSLPTIAVAVKLLPLATGPGLVELGNLSTPIPAITAAGVWISGDYRYPQYAHRLPSDVLAVLVLVLAACGLIYAIRRRAWSVAWLGIAGLVAVFFVAHRYGPWVQFKADSITSPIALLMAFVGVAALIRFSRRTLVGAVPAIVLAVGVLAGTALLYHDTTLAPYARLHDLEYIGKRFAGQGPTLTPDFEEYAEYYLRDADQDSMVNGPRLELRPGVNRATAPGGTWAYDLDEYPLGFVESFRTIVMRRDPLASRPPSNFRLAYLSPYYEVWQREQPARTVSALVPLLETTGDRNAAACAELAAAARKAGPSAQIAYMPSPAGYLQLDDSNLTLSGGFAPSGGVIEATGSGRAVREQTIPVAGPYDFFIEGSFGRPVSVSVDGRHVGTAAYQVSYPAEWIMIASRRLSTGVHKVEITRGGVSLHAGNGDGVDPFNRTIGPLVIMPARLGVPTMRYGSVRELPRLCRASRAVRWLEVTRSR
ncbi:MAG TPA: hypothetical protein VGH60_04445 [Solirubrobacteraceae bacterium]|jgi:hypothetical protein